MGLAIQLPAPDHATPDQWPASLGHHWVLSLVVLVVDVSVLSQGHCWYRDAGRGRRRSFPAPHRTEPRRGGRVWSGNGRPVQR